jgi:hypothetical protein
VHNTYGTVSKHWRGTIQGYTVLDVQFCEDLFNKDIMAPTEECSLFESMASRKGFCRKYLVAAWQGLTNCLAQVELIHKGQVRYNI